MASAISSNNFFVECETCDKGFESDAKCDDHLKRVCDIWPCNHKEFSNVTNLNKHIRSVHSETKYICGINGCQSSSSRIDSLNDHQRRVHGVK